MITWVTLSFKFEWESNLDPCLVSLCGTFVLMTMMKCVSYSQVSTQVRLWKAKESKNPEKNSRREYSLMCAEVIRELRNKETSVEELLNWRAMLMFFVFPTCCFQLRYKRTRSINWTRVAKYGALLSSTMIFAMFVLLFLLIPQMKQISTMPLHGKHSLFYLTLTSIRISVTGTVTHHLMFLGILVGYMNLVAEVTRFAQRDFYQDWWNLGSIEEFWRKWNRPVHQFLKRHVARPLNEAVNSSESFEIFDSFCRFSSEWNGPWISPSDDLEDVWLLLHDVVCSSTANLALAELRHQKIPHQTKRLHHLLRILPVVLPHSSGLHDKIQSGCE